MEYLLSLRPYAFTLAFVFMAVSVLTGLFGAYLGEGIKFGNKRPEIEPKTVIGRRLRTTERLSLRTAIFMVLLAMITGVFTPSS